MSKVEENRGRVHQFIKLLLLDRRWSAASWIHRFQSFQHFCVLMIIIFAVMIILNWSSVISQFCSKFLCLVGLSALRCARSIEWGWLFFTMCVLLIPWVNFTTCEVKLLFWREVLALKSIISHVKLQNVCSNVP